MKKLLLSLLYLGLFLISGDLLAEKCKQKMVQVAQVIKNPSIPRLVSDFKRKLPAGQYSGVELDFHGNPTSQQVLIDVKYNQGGVDFSYFREDAGQAVSFQEVSHHRDSVYGSATFSKRKVVSKNPQALEPEGTFQLRLTVERNEDYAKTMRAFASLGFLRYLQSVQVTGNKQFPVFVEFDVLKISRGYLNTRGKPERNHDAINVKLTHFTPWKLPSAGGDQILQPDTSKTRPIEELRKKPATTT